MLDEAGIDKASRAMALLLRHNPGGRLRIDPCGWASVDGLTEALRSLERFSVGFDRAWVAEVLSHPKGRKRFALSEDGLSVRALSGHSFEVLLDLEPYEPSGPLWLGLAGKSAARTLEEGVEWSARPMARLLESREEAERQALARDPAAGAVVEVDALALARDGWRFGRSGSGEVLTPRFGAAYCSPAAPLPRP